MYVLFAIFKRVISPSLMPATPQGIIDMACSFEQVPCAVSKDENALNDHAKELRSRFRSTFESYEILQVPEIEPKEASNAD